jgi:tetratricopeptide (TPR) repeat protein
VDGITEAEDLIAYCREHELVLFEQWARFNHGALLAQGGESERGITIMEAAVAAAEAGQSFLFRPFQLSCIGKAYFGLGNVGRARELLDRAIDLAGKGGEKQSLAGLHRIRGEILLHCESFAEGLLDLNLALDIARSQRALMDELRVAITMVRLRDHGDARRGASLELLRMVYSKFNERLELPELSLARELLAAPL